MADSFRDTLLKLCRREDLSRDEASAAFNTIMSGKATDAQIGGLLVGLAAKGTTVDELVGAATVMRQKVVRVEPDPADRGAILLDTCGTGGDVRNTFNISTVAALIVAGAGVKVVKHGNRSASGKCGSADVLERLGVKLEGRQKAPPPDTRASLVRVQTDRLVQRVNLNLALGGSFDPRPAEGPAGSAVAAGSLPGVTAPSCSDSQRSCTPPRCSARCSR